MKLRLAINGLGRIGRCAVRILCEQHHSNLELVAINATQPAESYVTLLKYDSIHGRFQHEVTAKGDQLIINGRAVQVFQEKHPENIPWSSKDVNVVLECTGKFTSKEDAAKHLSAGGKRVIISAASKDADATIVYGVNNYVLSPKHKVISVASCTTNALAPLAKVLNDTIGIECGYMTTLHAYTMDQNLLDNTHKDSRRARAAGLSMIPATTGAAKALELVIPELAGKVSGSAVRVPVPNVSMIDFTFLAKVAEVTPQDVNHIIKAAVDTNMKNIIGIAERELVSIDFNHTPYSTIFDPYETRTVNKRLVRIASWYDNEWGFTHRMLDVAGIFKV
jgi:glyceraldehyde 3-phosphate dehydrogenase